MSKLSDYVSVADAFVVFEEEFQGGFVPIASNSLTGAGFYDEEASISRLATPLDMERLQSIQPPSSWEDLPRVLNEIWMEISLQDVAVILGSGGIEVVTITGNLGAFAEEAGMAYSKYINVQFEGYIELVSAAIPVLIKAERCKVEVLNYSLERLVNFLFNSENKQSLEMMKNDLLNHIAQNPDCEPLLKVIDALTELIEAIDWLRNQSLSELWEEIGCLALIAAEILRNTEVVEKILEVRSDPIKLGKLYGTLIGIIVWEIIEVVVSRGMSKGLRFVKVAL